MSYYSGTEYTLVLDSLSDLEDLLLQMKHDMKMRALFDSVTTAQAAQAVVITARLNKIIPAVSSIAPTNAATGVSASTTVAVTWNVPMDTTEIGLDFVSPGPIYLIPLDGAAVPDMALSVAWTNLDKTATIAVTSGPLEAAKTYQVIVGAGGGHPLSISAVAMPAPYEQAAGFVVHV